MKSLLKTSLEKAYGYQEYKHLVQRLADNNSSTGIPNEDKVRFTKMNFQRMNRLDRTLHFTEEEYKIFSEIPKRQTWLVILESWCGDGAQTIPVLNKIAEMGKAIDLKIVIRDENPELIDRFLTNGSRAIPKLIILDEEFNVIGTWGSRSRAATELVQEYKAKFGKIDENFKAQLQIWYNKDKGKNIIKELAEIEEEILQNNSPALLS